MPQDKLGGLLLIAGGLLFWVGAFIPQIAPVYSAPEIETRIATIERYRGLWSVQTVLFFAGITVAGIGLWVLALALQPGGARTLALAGAVGYTLAIVASVPWLYPRLVLPADQIVGADAGFSIFAVFTVLTALSLIVFGVGLARSAYPAWLGIVGAAFSGLLLVLYFVFGDMPPFAHYTFALFVGIALQFLGGR
jgi:hypothetical protein